MSQSAQPTRAHRPMTVAFHEAPPSCTLLGHTQAVSAFVLAFLLSIGCPRAHQAAWRGGGGRTRHSPSARVRRGGRTIWRVQGPTGPAVCTALPPCLLRSRSRRPEGARAALFATHGGRRVAWGAGIHPRAPLTRSRLGGARGPQRLGPGRTRGGLGLPP